MSCYLAISAICGPGDEVIIPAPYWVSYPDMVAIAGANPKILTCSFESNYKVTIEQLNEAYSDRTKMLILNSPSNPTGAMYNKSEIEAIVEWALSNDVFILSDEIYEYLTYDNSLHVSPASLSSEAADRVITVGGFSKTYSMTGWRLGTLVANPVISKAVSSIQSQLTSNATSFAQFGALAAIQNETLAKQARDQMKLAFLERRNFLVKALNDISGIECHSPEGAFYVFPNISQFGFSSLDFSSKLLDEKLVATVPGMAFGYDQAIRLSYANSMDIISDGASRISDFCNNL